MGSFTERAGAYRRDKDARFQAMINDAAKPSFLTKEQQEIARLKSINHFRNIGLYDFLMDSVSHAKSVDGHHDARIEFDFHEAGRATDRIHEKDDTAERRLLLALVKHSGTVATAQVRWDIKPGDATNGYTSYHVSYFPESPRRIIVQGKEETCDLYLDLDFNEKGQVVEKGDQFEEGFSAGFKHGQIENAIIEAYFDPDTQMPLVKHPDDLPSPEAPSSPQSPEEEVDYG